MIKCKKCGIDHDGRYGSGLFCSKKCASSRVFTDESRLKKSISARNHWQNMTDDQILKSKKRLKDNTQKRSIKVLEDLMNTEFDFLGKYSKRRRVLIEQNNKCLICGIKEWRGDSITLEYDHIDGNKQNESRNNLRFLCPNCHSQTETWRGRNNVGSKNANWRGKNIS